MALKFDRADRNYMRAFTIGIGVLALITLIDIGIATWVWSSQGKPDRKNATAFADSTPTLVGIPARGPGPISKAGSAAEAGGAASTAVASAAAPSAAAPSAAAPSAAAPSATAPSAPAQPPQGASAVAASYQYNAREGETLFGSTCAACHQATGEGIPGVFPPLRGNAAVNDDDPGTQLLTMLNGRHGTKIGGQVYSGVMPPFGSQFSDVQIADIANYERSSWGNHAKPVTPAEIAALRAKAK